MDFFDGFMEIRLNHRICRSREEILNASTPEVAAFLDEWFAPSDFVWGHTSGSTGTPKPVRLLKRDMEASARLTNDFFDITCRSVMLLCLSPDYIAGKMMIVRALLSGADLLVVTPSSLIIGGAPLSPGTEVELEKLPVDMYATYGMTETVSHVALRRIGDSLSLYCALDGISFSIDERNCLIIHAPHFSVKEFVTNDVVELVDSRNFRWIGRYDHVINTGGIKVFPELIEKKIAGLFTRRFFVTSCDDLKWGESVALVIEGEALSLEQEKILLEKIRAKVNKYEFPRKVLYVQKFKETSSGKVIRNI